ncbi:plastid division protein PDV1-like [Impatiens glandulifera]|uniref:plastid division protein PDV1-like n=1 Tax=Impatiens glandulifera TaxID=253017 RepID=UPI001FB0CF03|nr:plastid division protein PDV1-like [Impatiens glandulifera]
MFRQGFEISDFPSTNEDSFSGFFFLTPPLVCKWEMEIEEVESVMEKIWDLHDKLSDAIHSISRSHYLTSIRCVGKGDDTFHPRNFANKKPPSTFDNNPPREGFVYVKDFPLADDNNSEIHEAQSLNAIRTALENLEDQLEFFHTVQTQQRAERDSAIARLEQSRIILAMRLAEHQGKKYKVIEEAQAFVGNVKDANCFVTPENHFVSAQSPAKTQKGIRSADLVKAVISGFHCAQKTLKDQMGGLFGNAALIAISMFALLQLHKAGNVGNVLEPKSNVKRVAQSNNSPFNAKLSNKLDVMLARG